MHQPWLLGKLDGLRRMCTELERLVIYREAGIKS
jgi:hypothetical protein